MIKDRIGRHEVLLPINHKKLGYLKDSNAAEHSVDSDIFYVVIYLFACSKTLTFISQSSVKLCCVTQKSVLVCVSFMHDNASMARCDKERSKEAHSDLNHVWTLNDTHQPPLYQVAKIDRCGNCGNRN